MHAISIRKYVSDAIVKWAYASAASTRGATQDNKDQVIENFGSDSYSAQ